MVEPNSTVLDVPLVWALFLRDRCARRPSWTRLRSIAFDDCLAGSVWLGVFLRDEEDAMVDMEPQEMAGPRFTLVSAWRMRAEDRLG